MANPTTTISFEHGKGNDPSNLDDGELCEDTIEVEMSYEPADEEVGIMQGGFSNESDVPNACPECGHVYDEDEKKSISRLMETAADEYEPDYDGPEPDEDFHRENDEYYKNMPMHYPGDIS